MGLRPNPGPNQPSRALSPHPTLAPIPSALMAGLAVSRQPYRLDAVRPAMETLAHRGEPSQPTTPHTHSTPQHTQSTLTPEHDPETPPQQAATAPPPSTPARTSAQPEA